MADTTISQLNTINTLSANNFIPISDGTNTTKLGTDSLFGFRNRIINGDMRIDQRNGGTSVAWAANTAGYTVDRFKQTQNGAVASTIQQTTDVPAAQGFTSSLSRIITTAEPAVASGNKTCGYYYMLEGYNVSDFLWGTASAKPITISFWVKSSVTGTFSFSVMNTTFTRSYNSSYSISSANTWEKKTFTVPGDTGATAIDKTNGNGIQLVFDLGFSSIYESSTANTWQGSISYALAGCVKLSSTLGATFYLTGLQLESGSTATPFETRFIGNELAMCQRYYEFCNYLSNRTYLPSSGAIRQFTQFKVTKRAVPSPSSIIVTNSSNTNPGNVSLDGVNYPVSVIASTTDTFNWETTACSPAGNIGIEWHATASAEL
jgi:hypothetical protein